MTLWHKTFQTLKVIETHVIAACAMCVFFIGNSTLPQNTSPLAQIFYKFFMLVFSPLVP